MHLGSTTDWGNAVPSDVGVESLSTIPFLSVEMVALDKVVMALDVAWMEIHVVQLGLFHHLLASRLGDDGTALVRIGAGFETSIVRTDCTEESVA